MADSDADKQYEATEQRRRQAREQGQVPRSQDLTSAVLLLAGLLGLLYFGQDSSERMGRIFRHQLGNSHELQISREMVFHQWTQIVAEVSLLTLPLLSLLVVVSAGVNLSQTGLLWLPDKVGPDLSHIDPLQNAQRIFSTQSLMRLLFGLFKIAIVAGMAAWALWGERFRLMSLTDYGAAQLAGYLVSLTLWTSIKVAIALVVLALFEYSYQYIKFENDLMMTHQEMREEIKEQMGDPQIINRRKKVQQELAKGRLKSTVPKATVVVTNPTELAIALQYEFETMASPVVLAKGAGILAQQIRRLALENSVPIVERKELARLLYSSADVGKPIPVEQYAAVAEVMRFVYELQGKALPQPKAGA